MCKKETIIPREFPIQWVLAAALVWSGACLGASTDPSLIGWWQLNESGGMAAADSSGKGNNATLAGSAVFTSGLYGNGVYCDGTEAYMAIPNILPATCTLAFWFKPDWSGSDASDYRLFDASAGDKYFFISKGANHADITPQFFGFYFEDAADADFQNIEITAAGNITAGTWYHVAVTWQFGGGAAILYLNGREISRGTNLGAFPTLSPNPRFGYQTISYIPMTRGAAAVLDDIKIFDRVLTTEEIPALMKGAAPELASTPSPWDKAVDVLRDTALNWQPGVYAAAHDVYLGTSAEDVANATRANPLGALARQAHDVNSFDPGRLDLGKTYYWRVDEVNAPPSSKIFTGEVWSFTVEPYSVAITGITADADSVFDAQSVAQKTVDGSGLSATDQHSVNTQDMWISGKTPFPHWIQYTFDKVYKLDQMWVWNSNQTMESVVGFGAKDVLVQYSAGGDTWTDLGNFVFTRAPGDVTCSADTKVAFGGVAARYVKLTLTSNWGGFVPQGSLSEVRFYAIPGAAREPAPTSGTTNLHPQVTLRWRAGREAGSHEVYVGTDPNAVAASTTPTATTAQAQYEVPLNLEKTYYWKVVEVNHAEAPAVWPSDVWSFSTATYISIDDFESYTNESPKRVFQTWIDGAGFSADKFFPNGASGNGTGSLVGYDPTLGDVMETANFYDGGKQSMPLYYDNSAAPRISEAVRALDPAKDTTDWTRHGLTTLVLWFRGDPANGAAPVYVKINGTKKLYNNGAAATTTPIWKLFLVDLASVPVSDLKNVKTITVGVGDGSAGGTGTILIDEIRLYATAPQIVVPTDPGAKGLEALYAMEGDVKDSSGKGRNGTASGDPGYVDGPVGYGKALAFDGTNDYVDLPIGNLLSTLGGSTFAARVNFANTGGAWQRVFDFGTGTTIYMFLTPRQGTSGAMRCAITTGSNTAESGANGPATLPTGWHHVAVVFDDVAMQIRLYMDGTLVGSGATTLLPRNLGVTTQNWLGRSQWPGDGFLTGSIDDFRIYSRPLAEGEVLYLAGDR